MWGSMTDIVPGLVTNVFKHLREQSFFLVANQSFGQFLLQAANLPISIIIVGVGNADFSGEFMYLNFHLKSSHMIFMVFSLAI